MPMAHSCTPPPSCFSSIEHDSRVALGNGVSLQVVSRISFQQFPSAFLKPTRFLRYSSRVETRSRKCWKATSPQCVQGGNQSGVGQQSGNNGGGGDELYQVLDLATPEELKEVSDILYGQSLLSPLVKSLAVGDVSRREPIETAFQEGERGGEETREALLRRLEARFLFLAADSRATLRGHRPTYRGVLLAVKERLKVPCSHRLSTPDLEAEIFLHLIHDSDSEESNSVRQPLEGTISGTINPGKVRKGKLKETLMDAFKMGSEEILPMLMKGGSVMTVSTLQKLVMGKLTGKVLLERARYLVAKEALQKGGQIVATKLEAHLALLTARQGLAGAAARYVGLRSTMTLLGPLLWGTFLADMVIRAVGTDYARVVRAIFAFAQIRLTRTYGWTQADTSSP